MPKKNPTKKTDKDEGLKVEASVDEDVPVEVISTKIEDELPDIPNEETGDEDVAVEVTKKEGGDVEAKAEAKSEEKVIEIEDEEENKEKEKSEGEEKEAEDKEEEREDKKEEEVIKEKDENEEKITKPEPEGLSFASREIERYDEPKEEDLSPTARVSKTGKRMLGGFVALTVFLVLFIAFVALPTGTVYLEPRSEEVTFATSVTFADNTLNSHEILTSEPNMVATEPTSFTLELSRDYPATGELFEGQAARGELTIYNRGTKSKHFVPSRFQTDDGLIFWTEADVVVPAREDSETPGEITVTAHAADYDLNGKAIGERGNLVAGQELTMPAIPYLSPLLYYGMNKKPFYGGTANITKIVLQEDIDLARVQVEEELAQKAAELMKEKVISRNQLENKSDTLLTGDGAFDYEVEVIEVDDTLLGQKMSTFPATVRMKTTGRTYNQDDLYRILMDGLTERVDPDMKLADIDFTGMEMSVIERDSEQGRIRINIEVKARTVYDFDPESAAGKRSIAKMRMKLVGQSIEWAEKYLQNLEEIENADVVAWPFWRDKLPGVENNIRIKVKD